MYKLCILKNGKNGFDDEFTFECADFEEVISIMKTLQNKVSYFEISKEE